MTKSIYDITANEAILDAAWLLNETIAICEIEDADIAERIPMEYIAHKTLDGRIIAVHGELPVSAEIKLDALGLVADWSIWADGELVTLED